MRWLSMGIRVTPAIWMFSSDANASRLVFTLRQFGFDFPEVTVDDFVAPDNVVQLGRLPGRIDILTTLTGVDFDGAWARKITAEIEGQPVFVLSKEDLIVNKRRLGRAQDLADLEKLEAD